MWHSYGNSTIGARADVENVSIDRLQAFYRNYYQPDNAVLIITGKFDEAKTLAIVAREFGRIPKPTRKLQPFYTVDPEQQGERTVTLRRAGDTQIVLAVYHVPAGPSAKTLASFGKRIVTLLPPPGDRASLIRRPAPSGATESTRAAGTGVWSSGAGAVQRVRAL